ncbi:MAG TPA: ferritin-like domain-containing protein [Candidatus Limnocylindrales bacterium]|nr:ferritin-like domain-containing protein [Candidatus Limnocylindrales bacterium]
MKDLALDLLPQGARRVVDDVLDAVAIAGAVENKTVLAGMLPSVARGVLLKRGKQGTGVLMPASYDAHFDFGYGGDYPEMYDLYRRAVANQWNADEKLDWSIDVDPDRPERLLMPMEFVPVAGLAEHGIRLDDREQKRFLHDFTAFILSQFLHGEQGALYASAQVTESVRWFDGKFYGATQVMDEARHVEVFLRYIDTKLCKLYPINDNLFTIIDALMHDSRWDMKFLGMQIMIEGLALGAFNTMYQSTREPLMKEMLRYVIQDEARHVHYGVLALKSHYATLGESELREREDWAFEVALLMRNRFLAHEVYDEWFGGRLRRREWDRIMTDLPLMKRFRSLMFKRLIPNLEYIGLYSPRIRAHYERAGLAEYAGGRNASELTAEDMLSDAA